MEAGELSPPRRLQLGLVLHRLAPACTQIHSINSLQPGAFPVVAVSDPEAIRQAFEVFNYPKSPL